MVDNWSDSHATVRLATTVYKCCELFGADLGPNIHYIKGTKDRGIETLAKELHAVVAEQAAQASQGELSEKKGLLQQGASQRRQDSAAKARNARAKASVERKKLRRVALS